MEADANFSGIMINPLFLIFTFTASTFAAVIRMSPRGPVKKPEAARDATRAPTKPARIVVAGGVYPLSGTLLLDGRDSLVTWEAAPGAKPVFHGGRAITGWTKTNDGLWKAALPDKNNVQLTGNHHDRNHQR